METRGKRRDFALGSVCCGHAVLSCMLRLSQGQSMVTFNHGAEGRVQCRCPTLPSAHGSAAWPCRTGTGWSLALPSAFFVLLPCFFLCFLSPLLVSYYPSYNTQQRELRQPPGASCLLVRNRALTGSWANWRNFKGCQQHLNESYFFIR